MGPHKNKAYANKAWSSGFAGSGSAAPGAAGLLGLAAAPTFALMALWTGPLGAPPDIVCAQGASPLNGMAVMYALMSVFHFCPWLKLFAGNTLQGSRWRPLLP